MGRIFAVSVGDEILPLDPERRGEITYTVTNNSSRPARGRAKIVPFGSTRSEWLKIAGEVERDFQARGTHQVGVRVEVPPGIPPGRYTFRLDVVSTSNPEEEFTEGPIVAAQVVASEAPKTAGFPWWILAIAGVVVLIAGGVVAYLLFSKAKVPDVLRTTAAQARSRLERDKFKVQFTEQHTAEEAARGTVVKQDPAPETKLRRGSVVKLTLEIRPAEPELSVPEVTGYLEDTARARLERLCEPQPCVSLQVVNEMSGSVGSAEVIRTEPAAGSPLQPGDRITLFVNGFIRTGAIGLDGGLIEAFDLETGNSGPPDAQTDLTLDAGARVLRSGGSLSGARFLAFGIKTGPDWCLQLPATAGFDEVRLDSISPGLCGCLRTSAGNIAEVNIIEVEANRLGIWYRVWRDVP
jgi:hypothetical protein